MFRERIPGLSTPFHSILSYFQVFDLGLSRNPITYPLIIATTRGLGWKSFWINGDYRDGS